MKNQWRPAVLILILPLTTMMPYLAMAILMNDIMISFNVGLTLAGLSMTVMLAISGVCMFLGSGIQGKLGIRNTILLSLLMTLIGSFVCFIAPNFIVFFSGRIISGIGLGLNAISVMPYVGVLFKDNSRTFMITANLIANSFASIISLSIASPLRELTGGWQGVFGLYTAFIFLIALLWLIFTPAEQKEIDISPTEQHNVKQESPLRRAFKVKQYRLLMVIGIFTMCAITAITAFMPTFLVYERGFSLGFSVMAANVNNAAFVLGALTGGVLVARLGKRKIIIQVTLVAMMLGGLLFARANTQVLIMLAVIILGLGFMAQRPPQTTLMMEAVKPLDPILIGGASALVSGTGQIASLAVSPLFSILSDNIGMSGAFIIFFGTLAIAILLSFMLIETSP